MHTIFICPYGLLKGATSTNFRTYALHGKPYASVSSRAKFEHIWCSRKCVPCGSLATLMGDEMKRVLMHAVDAGFHFRLCNFGGQTEMLSADVLWFVLFLAQVKETGHCATMLQWAPHLLALRRTCQSSGYFQW